MCLKGSQLDRLILSVINSTFMMMDSNPVMLAVLQEKVDYLTEVQLKGGGADHGLGPPHVHLLKSMFIALLEDEAVRLARDGALHEELNAIFQQMIESASLEEAAGFLKSLTYKHTFAGRGKGPKKGEMKVMIGVADIQIEACIKGNPKGLIRAVSIFIEAMKTSGQTYKPGTEPGGAMDKAAQSLLNRIQGKK